MQTMIERVARAIAEANQEDYDAMPDLHTALARAAIAAMREPSDGDVIETIVQAAMRDLASDVLSDDAGEIRGDITWLVPFIKERMEDVAQVTLARDAALKEVPE